MSLQDSLGRFIESSSSEHMPVAAAHLLELIEADEVEPIGQPGSSVVAEEIAERLESRLERMRTRGEEATEGFELIEDAVAQLRAYDTSDLAPWTFEDSEGIRWFVLRDPESDEVIACYTSAPFVESDA
jgi:hypothetical protein